MPIHKVKGGYQYGNTGKAYPQKSQAIKQMRAIKVSQNKKDK